MSFFLSFFDSNLSKIIICVILIGIAFLYYKKTREGMVNKQQQINKPPTQDTPNFIKHDSFKGEIKGFVFKTGESGLGYYKDLINIHNH